jgi:hypothetical protein
MTCIILEKVRFAAAKRILFLPHAVKQMSKPERMIKAEEVYCVVMSGQIIEDYPEDVRGHSCLIRGFGADKRPIHVVCSPKEDYLAIITAYLPSKKEWSNDFTRRRV